MSLKMLALLLERIAEKACGDTRRTIRDDLRSAIVCPLGNPGKSPSQARPRSTG
ncbi:MAG TPA: hypothetical protein VMK12_20190 [Anaeromyxobacteraceae bacterium]|nr:hypothetical protein [Anaeromyxobacteraceae bacterium]